MQTLGTFPDWSLPYIAILAAGMWIGLALLPPRDKEWEDEQASQDREMEQ